MKIRLWCLAYRDIQRVENQLVPPQIWFIRAFDSADLPVICRGISLESIGYSVVGAGRIITAQLRLTGALHD
jgi:hypothetical protein